MYYLMPFAICPLLSTWPHPPSVYTLHGDLQTTVLVGEVSVSLSTQVYKSGRSWGGGVTCNGLASHPGLGGVVDML